MAPSSVCGSRVDQVADAALRFRDRRKIFPAQPERQGEVRPHLPLVLRIERVGVGAEVALRVGRRAGPGLALICSKTGVSLARLNSPWNEYSGRAPPTRLLLSCSHRSFGAELQRVIAGDFAQAVAQLELVLREFAGRGLALRRAEADAVGNGQSFDLQPRNAEVHVGGVGDAIVRKAREVESGLVEHGGGDGAVVSDGGRGVDAA